MCLGVCFLGSKLFGTLWASWTSWKPSSFARLGKFSYIISSNKFSISCSSSSPSGTPMIQMLEHLKLSWTFLSFSSFCWILVSSFFSGWMFISSFWYKLLIWVLVSFLSLLVPYSFSFISFCIAFTSSSILRPSLTISVSILITSVLNSASDRLAYLFITWFCFWNFDLFFHLGHIFFVLACLLHSKGWSLRYSPGQGNPCLLYTSDAADDPTLV